MDKALSNKLKELQTEYKKKLPDKIKNIEEIWATLNAQFSHSLLVDLHREAHTLCGSAGTYGFLTLSKNARALESYLKSLLEQNLLSTDNQKKINALLSILKSDFYSHIAITPPILASNVNTDLVFGLALNETLTADITNALRLVSYQYVAFDDFEKFFSSLEKKMPFAVILDGSILSNDELKKLKTYHDAHHVVYIFLGAENNIYERLQSTQADADLFFEKTAQISMLANLIVRYASFRDNRNFKVLVLDDEQSLVDYYTTLIKNAGIDAKSLTNPLQLLEELDQFSPDLLLMDLYMPGCTGLECAAILRQSEKYFNLPIIFISTEENRSKQLSSLTLGGADLFLTKPILPEQLIQTIKFRLRRSLLLNSYITRDRLTGLLSHAYILEALYNEIKRSEKTSSSFLFAMLDIDFFKKVNDTYGHPAGDHVLKQLSDLLVTELRKTDVIGRYGGEEFAIIFPDTAVIHGKEICQKLIEKIRAMEVIHARDKIKITVSIGFSSFPERTSSMEILAAADEALYFVKKHGRDNVCIYNKNEINVTKRQSIE